ncbi:RNA polymerase sigma factor SigM [Marmoricola sp. URHB0036]|uniref:RNA polymerase sigma factor SigM n=1 Tax=Marmoricola sp. URHB0036 TaxID=1298863 RepID=UPI00041DF320|nr:RNA polymerase sigma factor SigM [Marmoricola sp. URHB0036]
MTTREDSDASLVEAHLAGDPEAFGELFRRHRDRLWAVALRTTGNPEDAADALQDALISAFRRADSYRGDAAVTTWLHRIVVNASLDRLRRRKVRAADPLPDDLDDAAARGAVLAGPDDGPDPGPEAHAVASERRRQVLAALEQLPPDQKAALVLVDMEGYPVAEAAEILEVPTGTVKSRCARGRARLAVLLADLGPPGTREPPGASHSGGPPGDPPPSPSASPSASPAVRTSERAIEGGEQP